MRIAGKFALGKSADISQNVQNLKRFTWDFSYFLEVLQAHCIVHNANM